MKKIISLFIIIFLLCSCQQETDSIHQHEFVNYKCACGEIDPNHDHIWIKNERCTCGEIDPNHTHIYFNHSECFCGEKLKYKEHNYEMGICECGDQIDISTSYNEAKELIKSYLYFENDFSKLAALDGDYIYLVDQNGIISEYDQLNSSYSELNKGLRVTLSSTDPSLLNIVWHKRHLSVQEYKNELVLQVNPKEFDETVFLTITVEAPYIQDGITKTVEDSKTIEINIEKRIKPLKTNIGELKLYYKINFNNIYNTPLFNTHLGYVELEGIVSSVIPSNEYATNSFFLSDKQGNAIFVKDPDFLVYPGQYYKVYGRVVINQNGVLEFSLDTHLRYLGYSEEIEPIVSYIDKWYNDFTEPINHLDYFAKFIRVKGVILKVEDYYIIKSKFSDKYFKIYQKSIDAVGLNLEEYLGYVCMLNVTAYYLKDGVWIVVLTDNPDVLYEYDSVNEN